MDGDVRVCKRCKKKQRYYYQATMLDQIYGWEEVAPDVQLEDLPNEIDQLKARLLFLERAAIGLKTVFVPCIARTEDIEQWKKEWPEMSKYLAE
jgi:hypothetical protein